MYGDAAGFVTYHDARGRDIPGTWDTTAINAALLVASDWIDSVYGPSFIGYKTDGFLQDREWPRTDAVVTTSYPRYTYDTTAIPDRVKQSSYEAAYRELSSPGSLQIDFKPGKYKRVQIDGAVTVDYDSTLSASDVQVQIMVIDSLLWPLIDTSMSGANSTLSGGSKRV